MSPGKLLVLATGGLLWAGSAVAQTPIIYDVGFEGFALGAPPPTSDTLGDRPFIINSNLGAAVLNRSRMPSDSLPVINGTQFVRLTESCGPAPAMYFDRNQSVSTGIIHAGFDVLFETFERYQIGFRNGRQSSGGINGSAARILADIFTLGEPVANNMRFVSGENVAPFSVTISYEIGMPYRIDAYFDMDNKRWHAFINGGSFENHKVVDNAPIVPDAPIGFTYFGFDFSSFCEGQSPTQPPIPGASFAGAMQMDNFVFERVASIPGVVAAPPPPAIANILDDVGRPFGVAIHGGYAYVADVNTHTVWKIDLTTKQKSPVAGIGWNADDVVNPSDRAGYNGDGIDALQAQLDTPSGIAVDANGNLYIADTGNNAIRRIGAGSSFITTVAGIPTQYAVGESTLAACQNPPTGFDMTQCAPATGLRLYGPKAIAVDADGNLFIADRMNQQIKKLYTSGNSAGFIFVVAGVAGETGRDDGLVSNPAFCHPDNTSCSPAPKFNSPVGVAVLGNVVYVADEGNNAIRVIEEGNVATLSTGLVAPLLRPTGVAVGGDGTIFIADYGHHRIQATADCDGLSCSLLPIAGTGAPGAGGEVGGAATLAQLDSPISILLDGDLLYIADMRNGRIVVVDVLPAPAPIP